MDRNFNYRQRGNKDHQPRRDQYPGSHGVFNTREPPLPPSQMSVERPPPQPPQPHQQLYPGLHDQTSSNNQYQHYPPPPLPHPPQHNRQNYSANPNSGYDRRPPLPPNPDGARRPPLPPTPRPPPPPGGHTAPTPSSSRQQQQHHQVAPRNYRLLGDPAIHGIGAHKRYAYFSLDIKDSLMCPPDPRNKNKYIWASKEILMLLPTRFKMDKWFVGRVEPKEVTFENLNDNINESFLNDMCLPFGEIVECSICRHPKTKKHLGIAKVLYRNALSSGKCVKELNKSSKMGHVIKVYIDPKGALRNRAVHLMLNPHLATPAQMIKSTSEPNFSQQALDQACVPPQPHHPPIGSTLPPPLPQAPPIASAEEQRNSNDHRFDTDERYNRNQRIANKNRYKRDAKKWNRRDGNHYDTHNNNSKRPVHHQPSSSPPTPHPPSHHYQTNITDTRPRPNPHRSRSPIVDRHSLSANSTLASEIDAKQCDPAPTLPAKEEFVSLEDRIQSLLRPDNCMFYTLNQIK